MKKTLALVLSLFALAYVGLVYADDGENEDGQNTNQEQQREQDKKQWEQQREQKKDEWEQEREQLKTERKKSLEGLKQEKEKLRSEFKDKLDEDRCDKIEEKIHNQTAKLGSAKIKHMSVYINLQNRIQKFINKFETFYTNNPNADATERATLRADIDALKTDFTTGLKPLIATFQASLADFSSKIGDAKKSTCADTEGDVRSSLADARVYLQTVHANAAAVRTYVRETILPDLLAVKKDIAKIKGETDDENKTEDENKDEDENKTLDTTAPAVSITSPVNGTSYATATSVTISASATDNDEVEKVEFYDGGVLKSTDEEAPYSYGWAFTASDNGTHSWTVKAYDDAEPANTAVSAPANLTVTIL